MTEAGRRTGVMALGVLLWLAGNIHGATYYVATNGNDAASGTTTNTPFRTPERAITAVNAGDTLAVIE